MRKIILLLFLSSTARAACPLFTYGENHKLDQEVNNLCDNILNPTINYETVTKGAFGSLSVSTITAVSSATITNLTVTNFIGGKLIKQIVSATSVTTFATTSASYVNTNLSASITPTSASDNILVMAYGEAAGNVGTNQMFITLARNGTNMVAANGFSGPQFQMAGFFDVPFSTAYLDSPATTSATTYAVQIKNTNGTNSIFFGNGPTTQSMVLVEVAP